MATPERRDFDQPVCQVISRRKPYLGVGECEVDDKYEDKAWYDEDEVVSPADISSDGLAFRLASD